MKRPLPGVFLFQILSDGGSYSATVTEVMWGFTPSYQ